MAHPEKNALLHEPALDATGLWHPVCILGEVELRGDGMSPGMRATRVRLARQNKFSSSKFVADAASVRQHAVNTVTPTLAASATITRAWKY